MTFSCVPGSGIAGGATLMGAVAPRALNFQVQWNGPFRPGETRFPNRGGPWLTVVQGMNVAVSQAEVDGLAASDPEWWVITG